MAASVGQVVSGGGAVFIGDVNAGRDINISHITTVRPVARSLHHSLFTSSDQFRPIQNDLASLMTMLETITEANPEFQVDCEEEPKLCELARESHEILCQLLELKEHYDLVGSQTQKTWEREQWRAEDVANIRSKLNSTTSALSTVYTQMIHSSTKTILAKLDVFMAEVRSGKREGSVVTNCTINSISGDEKQAWRQLRKELEDIGITPVLFNQHHDLIVTTLKEALDRGDEDLIEHSEEHSGNAEQPNDGLAQCMMDDCLNAKDSTLRGSTSRTVPQSHNQRNEVQPLIAPHLLPVRGPSRLARLLSRITGGESKLILAAKEGNNIVFRELLQKGVNIESKDKLGRTPLSLAAERGYGSVVRMLLQTGSVNIESKDEWGKTPLSLAAERGITSVVRMFLETGSVNIESKDKRGMTPLSLAAQNGHEDVVKVLLETGNADVKSKDNEKRTPLSLAALNDCETVVKLLLEMGNSDIESKDESFMTPLSLAARNGHGAVVKVLLEMGNADVNSKDLMNRTPLFLAVESGHEAVVKVLLEIGNADVDSKDEWGMAPLSLAAQNGNEAVVRVLLEMGNADVNSKDLIRRTPLSLAAQNGNEAVVKVLLEIGNANVKSRDYSYRTPLSLAAEAGHKAVAKILLERQRQI